MLDLRTNREKKRDELHERVCEAYTLAKAQNPEANHHRLSLAVAEQTGLTRTGVDIIVTRHGLHKRKIRINHLTP